MSSCTRSRDRLRHGLVLSGAKANELEVLSAGTSLVARVSLKNDEWFEGIVGATVCSKP